MATTNLTFSTNQRYQLLDITKEAGQSIKESRTENGLALIFVPHSTAAIILTENEEGLKKDWLSFLKGIISGYDFEHNKIDNNADSHLLSGLLSQTKTLPIENGNLIRGTWQQVFLVELDGPRERKVIIQTS